MLLGGLEWARRCVGELAGLSEEPALGRGHKRSRSRLEEVASDDRTLFGTPKAPPVAPSSKAKPVLERTAYSHCRSVASLASTGIQHVPKHPYVKMQSRPSSD